MSTKRFQVQSEGLRLQAVLDTPDQGESWPLVILNHAGQREKDGAFFDGLVPLLLERGLAACRYDPRGFGQSEGSLTGASFWTRWVDLGAIIQATDDIRFEKTALVGTGIGATLSVWWNAVQPVDAVVCFGLPAPKKLGPLPRGMQDLLPPDFSEDMSVPHPTKLANTLIIFGDKDKDVTNAETFSAQLGAEAAIIPGADKSFTQVRARAAAMQQAVDWLEKRLRAVPAHTHEAAIPEEAHAPEPAVQEEES